MNSSQKPIYAEKGSKVSILGIQPYNVCILYCRIFMKGCIYLHEHKHYIFIISQNIIDRGEQGFTVEW